MPANVAFLGQDLLLHQAAEVVEQDAAQPTHQLGLRVSPELGEGAVGFEERLLNQVGGVYLPFEARVQVQPGEQLQIGSEAFQRLRPTWKSHEACLLGKRPPGQIPGAPLIVTGADRADNPLG